MQLTNLITVSLLTGVGSAQINFAALESSLSSEYAAITATATGVSAIESGFEHLAAAVIADALDSYSAVLPILTTVIVTASTTEVPSISALTTPAALSTGTAAVGPSEGIPTESFSSTPVVSPITVLPSIESSESAAPTSALSSIESVVSSALSSIESQASSVTSEAPSVTSSLASVASSITSSLASEASSITSSFASEASSITSSLASEASSFLSSVTASASSASKTLASSSSTAGAALQTGAMGVAALFGGVAALAANL